MFRLLEEVEGKLRTVAEEAAKSQENRWRRLVGDAIDRGQLEVKRLQELLAQKQRQIDSVQTALRDGESALAAAKEAAAAATKREEIATVAQKAAEEAQKAAEAKQREIEEECAQRIELYRGISEEAKAQQTLLRGKMESLARELATCRSEQESREQRESAREEEGNRLQTQLREKEEENVALRAKQSSLTMAMTGLVEKNELLGNRMKELREEYEEFQRHAQKELCDAQEKYEEQLKNLRLELEEAKIASAKGTEAVASSESSMRKEWEQLENQNQALKLRLQQKEAEVTELLSYVEEMMKEKGA
ncbi:hypothetical protein WA538_002859, partial [Blastocystis sp. DL]